MQKFKFLPVQKISNLPKTAGVYCLKNGGEILYIGKGRNIRKRVKYHFAHPSCQDSLFIGQVKKIGYIKTDSEIEALILEANLIKKYRPKYNITWRDDKNYFYVGITKEAFPRIFITHHFENRSRNEYVGPFVNGKELKQKLKELRKIYPYRTCKTLPKSPCLWYHLDRCPAPCLFKSRRIEAYDISNIQGKDAAGAMVTFINGKPNKNFYRRFKIKTLDKPNDVGMLKEVLLRRIKHSEWGLPDLILIDGGKAQLNIAIKSKNQNPKSKNIKVMALAKKRSAAKPRTKLRFGAGENKLYFEGKKEPILLKNLPRETFNLILQLRDEAHRFAVSYHRILRKKKLIEE